jgi:hypothetical protein
LASSNLGLFKKNDNGSSAAKVLVPANLSIALAQRMLRILSVFS